MRAQISLSQAIAEGHVEHKCVGHTVNIVDNDEPVAVTTSVCVAQSFLSTVALDELLEL